MLYQTMYSTWYMTDKETARSCRLSRDRAVFSHHVSSQDTAGSRLPPHGVDEYLARKSLRCPLVASSCGPPKQETKGRTLSAAFKASSMKRNDSDLGAGLNRSGRTRVNRQNHTDGGTPSGLVADDTTSRGSSTTCMWRLPG